MSLSLLSRALVQHGAEKIEAMVRAGSFKLEWRAIARPEQLAPGSIGSYSTRTDWRWWMALAGRRFGKTKSGAEWVQEEIMAGRRGAFALVAPTLNDAWKIMVDGDSGLLAVASPDWRPIPIRSQRMLMWPNGAKAEIFTSEEPDRLRGRSHDGAWSEELGFWKYPQATWDMLNISMSRTGPLGHMPRGFAATTPKAIQLLRELVKQAHQPESDIVMVTGSTYENAANLDPHFLRALLKQYEGTRLGEQELYARLLEDAEGALWKTKLPRRAPRGRSRPRRDAARGRGCRPGRVEPRKLGRNGHRRRGPTCEPTVLRARRRERRLLATRVGAGRRHRLQGLGATRVVVEKNNGGDLVMGNLRAHPQGKRLPITPVWAAKGKFARAEPVAAIYEQRNAHHLGRHPLLEQQMTQWEPAGAKESPSRIDALTWAITELMLGALIPTFKRSRAVAPRRMSR